MPSAQPIFSLDKKYQKNKLVIMEKITRSWKTTIFIDIGEPMKAGTKSVMPKIRVMFTKLLPMMSPKASPG